MSQSTIKKYGLLMGLFLGLSGCNALNFKTEPQIQEDCHYQTMSGVEFQFAPLPESELSQGYKNIFVAQSKNSATLSMNYNGLKGKLTNEVLERNYPKPSLWGYGYSRSRFGDHINSLADYDDEYFYLTQSQRDARDRKYKFVVRKAILENCQIVYIRIDALAKNRDGANLIQAANLKLLNVIK